MSHPSWVCGLKLGNEIHSRWAVDGHTLRGCVDWNLPRIIERYRKGVTPFVGVWIETLIYLHVSVIMKVTPFVGVWIETHLLREICRTWCVTPFVGVWIETREKYYLCRRNDVTPFVGVWIETWTISSSCMKIRVTSFVCVWIETPLPYHLFLRLPSHTLRGCVEWNRKQILFSEPTLKSHFYENVPLIVNKLQRQKIWFGTF